MGPAFTQFLLSKENYYCRRQPGQTQNPKLFVKNCYEGDASPAQLNLLGRLGDKVFAS